MKNIELENKGQISDGYHTFDELYEHRHALFSALCRIHPQSWKSKLHYDGTMYDDYFIAGIGDDITYHIPLRLWDYFQCAELSKGREWNGHTSEDVIQNLFKL